MVNKKIGVNIQFLILQMKTEKYQKKYRTLGQIKNEIKAINGGNEGEYGTDFIKIKFNTDDDLSLDKPLKLHMLTIIFRSVFEEDGKFYPHIYLDECLYEF